MDADPDVDPDGFLTLVEIRKNEILNNSRISGVENIFVSYRSDNNDI